VAFDAANKGYHLLRCLLIQVGFNHFINFNLFFLYRYFVTCLCYFTGFVFMIFELIVTPHFGFILLH